MIDHSWMTAKILLLLHQILLCRSKKIFFLLPQNLLTFSSQTFDLEKKSPGPLSNLQHMAG